MVTPFEATQSLPDGVREGMGNFAGGGGFFIEWREFEEGGVILIIEPFSKIKTFLFRQLMTS